MHAGPESCKQPCVVPNYQPCLCCGASLCHAFWCGASLSAMPVGVVFTIGHASGVVAHCWPCLLMWCLSIGRACWCGTSLSAMHVGVVPHYRPCLLTWYLTIGHACWSVPISTDILLVECRWKKYSYKSVADLYRGAITSDMSADLVPLSNMPACTAQLYQTCMLASFIQIRVFIKCFSISQGIWSVTNLSDMHTGKVPLQQVCKACQLPSWTPS